jgi:hypothetical protein
LHLTHNPTAPKFVAFWTNSGQALGVGLGQRGRQ